MQVLLTIGRRKEREFSISSECVLISAEWRNARERLILVFFFRGNCVIEVSARKFFTKSGTLCICFLLLTEVLYLFAFGLFNFAYTCFSNAFTFSN